PPTLLHREPDAVIPGTRVVTERTSATMRALMRLVVEKGTGKNADVPGYIVGGKTGTAEKQVDGRYKKNALITTFVGIFPANAPRYVVLAMLDEPKGIKETYGFATAGWTAAPVAKRIIARMAPLIGVPQQDPESPEIRRALELLTDTPWAAGTQTVAAD
ncbi:MAG: penicillin-binding protein 2, partial [Alphaproteobacteria bacterium]|nr:penicillin-binding protein 2 [Alphaproteobacteria bacterium]